MAIEEIAFPPIVQESRELMSARIRESFMVHRKGDLLRQPWVFSVAEDSRGNIVSYLYAEVIPETRVHDPALYSPGEQMAEISAADAASPQILCLFSVATRPEKRLQGFAAAQVRRAVEDWRKDRGANARVVSPVILWDGSSSSFMKLLEKYCILDTMRLPFIREYARNGHNQFVAAQVVELVAWRAKVACIIQETETGG